jgi:polyhydroxyalkanoate synthesis regulator phasin
VPMARDDRLKKAQAAGVDFIETARSKAEEFLQELARAGGETQGALDDLVAGSRKTGEQLVATISKEIRNQINSLQLVTKVDLQALESRLTRRPPAKKAAAAPAKAAGAATKASSAPATKAAAGPAKKTAAVKKAAPAKKATSSTAKAPAKTSASKAPAKKATKKTAG